MENDPQAAIEPIQGKITNTPKELVSTLPRNPQGQLITKKVTVLAGDNMANIFQRVGLSATELHHIMNSGGVVSKLKTIQPKQTLEFKIHADGSLAELSYLPSLLDQLIVTQTTQGFKANWRRIEPEVLIAFKLATISSENPSLYQAGDAANLSAKLIMQLSYIFQWDISFALDLRKGDTFNLLYEELYLDGERIGSGDILAAQINNLGNSYTAVQYQDTLGHKNYYTAEGRSLRKAFLRDPVHFSHVSSTFNLKRLHPIHKKVMPHRGIDYAARQGTPVVASGDGKITIARQNSASGRYIVIQHGEQYTTKYLHLSAFAKGIRSGKSVSQGETIGYVGATGWATAPHLHYEFLVHGVHRNPKTVKLPKARSISAASLANFQQTTAPVLTQLKSLTFNNAPTLSALSAQSTTSD